MTCIEREEQQFVGDRPPRLRPQPRPLPQEVGVGANDPQRPDDVNKEEYADQYPPAPPRAGTITTVAKPIVEMSY